MTKKDFGSVENAEVAKTGNRKAPTAKMVAYAQTIARNKKTPADGKLTAVKAAVELFESMN